MDGAVFIVGFSMVNGLWEISRFCERALCGLLLEWNSELVTIR
jgi:hypothetical protein